MKKLMLTFALLAMVNKAHCQLCLEYRCNSTLAPSYVNLVLLASASNVIYGPGLDATTFFSGVTVNATDKAVASANWGNVSSIALDPNDYFNIDLTPSTGNTIVIDSLSWWQRRSNKGPRIVEVKTSSNNFTTIVWTRTDVSADSFSKSTVTTGLPTFSSSLSIRIYGRAPVQYSGSQNGGTLRIDSLKVYAHIGSTLPIELLSFSAEAKERNVELSWSTASEKENDYFSILRSADNDSWTEIGRVAGAGNSQSRLDYKFVDMDPNLGINYYKLRQTDHNGHFEEFQTLVVFAKESSFEIHHVGEVIETPDGRSILYDNTGRIVDGLSSNHTLRNVGLMIIRTESGYVTKLLVTN